MAHLTRPFRERFVPMILFRKWKALYPRFDLHRQRNPSILAAIHRDPALSAKFELLKHEAEKRCRHPASGICVRYTEKRTRRQPARCCSRVSILAGLYRLDGDKRFAERAKEEMLAAAAWPDWHPVSDFLPTAELLNAEGIGYDWLYHYLPQERETILQAILSIGPALSQIRIRSPRRKIGPTPSRITAIPSATAASPSPRLPSPTKIPSFPNN